MNQAKTKVKKKIASSVDFQYKKWIPRWLIDRAVRYRSTVYHLNKLGIQYDSNILALDFSRADLDKFKMISKSLNHQDEFLWLNTLEKCLPRDNNIYKLKSNLDYCFGTNKYWRNKTNTLKRV